MVAFHYDENGYLIGMIDCDPHPLRPNGWIVPGMATLAIPPLVPQGHRARWNGRSWKLEQVPEPVVQQDKTASTRYGMVHRVMRAFHHIILCFKPRARQ